MNRLVWVTDIHLNFCTEEQIDAFVAEVADAGPEAILLGGDVAEADTIEPILARLDDAWQVPIYFVLGNHDFYKGSIREVRQRVAEMCRQRERLHYLTSESVTELTPQVALIGDDGWADGRIGNYPASVVMMNDYQLIRELAGHTKQQRWQQLMQLGDEAAEHVERVLREALQRYPRILLLTHVPPMREACWYDGAISDDEWAPHFTCQAVGETIRRLMRRRPEQRLTVLCGHTHGEGYAQPLPNVEVYTAAAEYGMPRVNRVIQLDTLGQALLG